jgi:hypothetical protein
MLGLGLWCLTSLSTIFQLYGFVKCFYITEGLNENSRKQY